jgi:hypothetical protein
VDLSLFSQSRHPTTGGACLYPRARHLHSCALHGITAATQTNRSIRCCWRQEVCHHIAPNAHSFLGLPVQTKTLNDMMLHLLRNGRVYLWSPAVPVVAGLICDGVLHWSDSDQPSALAAPVGWQQPHASSCTLLPEAAAMVAAAESQLLMGRGDPRTRRGKVPVSMLWRSAIAI